MPGSKTYTSNKVNELIEEEFIDGINNLEKQHSKSISNTVFWEITKVSISILATTLINLLLASQNGYSTPSWSDLRIISSCIIIFIVMYFIVNGLAIAFKWLFDAIFNKRLLSSEKKRGYLIFHKRIVNHIYLGISFENKFNMYISKASSKEDDLNLDLATNYMSQSAYYFKIAKEELIELIPERSSGILEKRNADFLNFIGFPTLNISLISAQRSLNRLNAAEKQIRAFIVNMNAKSNEGVIKQAYQKSINDLYAEIKEYIAKYEDFLERSITLQKIIDSQK